MSSLFFYEHNGVVSPPNVLVVIFWRFYVTYPHIWVQPHIGVSNCVVISLLRYQIIVIYHHCFSPNTMVLFHRHRCWLLYFCITIFYLLTDDCDHSLGSMITLEVLFWSIILSLYCYISLSPLSAGLCGITFISDFYSSAMAPYHHKFCLLLFLSYRFIHDPCCI